MEKVKQKREPIFIARSNPLLDFQNTIKHSTPLHPTPCTLSVDVHWNRCQRDSNSSSADNIKRVSYTLHRDPVIGIERQAECKKILDEVHNGKGLGGLLAMAIGDVGYHGGSSQLNTQVDKAHADNDGNRPRVLIVERLAPGKESGRSEN